MENSKKSKLTIFAEIAGIISLIVAIILGINQWKTSEVTDTENQYSSQFMPTKPKENKVDTESSKKNGEVIKTNLIEVEIKNFVKNYFDALMRRDLDAWSKMFPPHQATSSSPHTPPSGFHQPNDNLPPETSPKRRSSVSDLLQKYSINTLYLRIQNIMKPLPTQGYINLCFTTATIKGWKPLLKPDKYKDIVTDSMAFLVARQEVCFYTFVIMPNHIHWIWQMPGETDLSSVQQSMLKYVAGQIRVDLQTHHPLQKMRYIHQNPVQQKWKLADKAEDDAYSSASL